MAREGKRDRTRDQLHSCRRPTLLGWPDLPVVALGDPPLSDAPVASGFRLSSALKFLDRLLACVFAPVLRVQFFRTFSANEEVIKMEDRDLSFSANKN